MRLFMDRHEGLAGVTPADAAEAHRKDLELQDAYGVRYRSYWLEPERGTVFCFVEAPSPEAVEAVHRESHGLVPAKIIEVEEGMVEAFLGTLYEPAAGELWSATAFRVVAFTDIEGSTRLTHEVGDAAARRLFREHDAIVRRNLESSGGREVKHTGDGIMASFPTVSRAVKWAGGVQQELEERNRTAIPPLRARIGMSAGEPVAEGEDLFGATVQLAARLCDRAEPGSVLVANTVRELSLGKGYRYEDRDALALKGFSEPVRAFELVWRR